MLPDCRGDLPGNENNGSDVMIKKLLITLVVLIAAFAGYVAMQPDELLIQRQATIAAPPGAVFEQVNDEEMGRMVTVGEDGPERQDQL